jgi:hypothetical protein
VYRRCFLGFAPTYWLPLASRSFSSTPVVHFHGLLFSHGRFISPSRHGSPRPDGPPREGALPALPTSGPRAERINMLRERISQGIEPNYVGELVREGVEKDLPYIFTDLELEPIIEARFAAIKQGFDHIRGRNPKR